MGYGVIGSTTDSGSVSLGSSPGTPARSEIRTDRVHFAVRPPSSSGLGRRPLTPVAWVRIPSGVQSESPLRGNAKRAFCSWTSCAPVFLFVSPSAPGRGGVFRLGAAGRSRRGAETVRLALARSSANSSPRGSCGRRALHALQVFLKGVGRLQEVAGPLRTRAAAYAVHWARHRDRRDYIACAVPYRGRHARHTRFPLRHALRPTTATYLEQCALAEYGVGENGLPGMRIRPRGQNFRARSGRHR